MFYTDVMHSENVTNAVELENSDQPPSGTAFAFEIALGTTERFCWQFQRHSLVLLLDARLAVGNCLRRGRTHRWARITIGRRDWERSWPWLRTPLISAQVLQRELRRIDDWGDRLVWIISCHIASNWNWSIKEVRDEWNTCLHGWIVLANMRRDHALHVGALWKL